MNKDKLVNTLKTIKLGLEKNKELPIYEHFCFTGSIVFSRNLLFAITAPFKVPKPFAVNGFTFLDLLEASPAEDVKFSVEGTDLIVEAGDSVFELPIKTSDEFISNEMSLDGGFELDPVVCSSLKYALKTCSENQALEGYARVCVKSVNGVVILFSTDGDALTRYNTGLQVGQPVEFCIGRDFCNIVNDIAPNGKMTVAKDWVRVKTDDFEVYGQNHGSASIDYELEISNLMEADTAEMVPIPLTLQKALMRAIVVASIETSPTHISIKNNEMVLQTETPFGNVYDAINITHKNIVTKINAELLLDKMEDYRFIKFIKSCIIINHDKLLRLVANMA